MCCFTAFSRAGDISCSAEPGIAGFPTEFLQNFAATIPLAVSLRSAKQGTSHAFQARARCSRFFHWMSGLENRGFADATPSPARSCPGMGMCSERVSVFSYVLVQELMSVSVWLLENRRSGWTTVIIICLNFLCSQLQSFSVWFRLVGRGCSILSMFVLWT